MNISDTPLVEICCYSVLSCLRAEQAGAHRIELCGGLSEGGITPSIGLIEEVKKNTSIPIYVMIRPRGGDFLYSENEINTMLSDIKWAIRMGADGLVFGCLTMDGQLDEKQNSQLLEAAHTLPVTLHRAFDMTQNPFEAFEKAKQLGFRRILTSGQKMKAESGIDLLKQLAQKNEPDITIMAGSGVTSQNIPLFIEAGIREVHLSGQKMENSGMQYKQPNVTMATTIRTDEYARHEADYDLIKAAVEATITRK